MESNSVLARRTYTAVSTQNRMNMNSSTATPTVSIEPALTGSPSTLGVKATTNEQLVKYEAALRAQYGSLDALLVKMNNSASALSALQIKDN